MGRHNITGKIKAPSNQEIPRIVKPKFLLPCSLIPILRQMDSNNSRIIILRPLLILFSPPHLRSSRWSLSFIHLLQNSVFIYPPPCVSHPARILPCLIFYSYGMQRGQIHEALQCANFLHVLPLSEVKIFPSGPCSRAPSVFP